MTETTDRNRVAPTNQPFTPHFLGVAPMTPETTELYDADVASVGFVMNVSRLWAHAPAVVDELFDVMGHAASLVQLSIRERGILVTAGASTRRDSYCALSWGAKLASEADAELAASVLRGDDSALSGRERALAAWARAVAARPNDVTPADVDGLRAVGYGDAEILAITAYVALRLAFSTVNDALGAVPDVELLTVAPASVVAAVDYGRPVGTSAPIM